MEEINTTKNENSKVTDEDIITLSGLKEDIFSGLSDQEKNRVWLAVVYPCISSKQISLIFADDFDEAIFKVRDQKLYRKLGGEWIQCETIDHVSPAHSMILIHYNTKKKYLLRPDDFIDNNDYIIDDLERIATLEKSCPIICLVPNSKDILSYAADSEATLRLSLDVIVQKYKNISKIIKGSTTYPNINSFVTIFTEYSVGGLMFMGEIDMHYIWICIDRSVDPNKTKNYNFIYSRDERDVDSFYQDYLHRKYGSDETVIYTKINMMNAVPIISESDAYKMV